MYFYTRRSSEAYTGESAQPEQVEALREEMGLNDSFIVQYFRFITKALTGDFGRSYSTKKPVFDEVFARFPATLKLTVAAMIIAVIIGIPVGIISATKQYSALDSISMIEL